MFATFIREKWVGLDLMGHIIRGKAAQNEVIASICPTFLEDSHRELFFDFILMYSRHEFFENAHVCDGLTDSSTRTIADSARVEVSTYAATLRAARCR